MSTALRIRDERGIELESARAEESLEVFGRGRGESHPFPSARMRDRYRVCVKRMALEAGALPDSTVLRTAAIEFVAETGMPDRGHMDSNLMRSAGLGMNRYQSGGLVVLIAWRKSMEHDDVADSFARIA